MLNARVALAGLIVALALSQSQVAASTKTPGEAWKASDYRTKWHYVHGWTKGYASGYAGNTDQRLASSTEAGYARLLEDMRRFTGNLEPWVEGVDTFYADFRHWDHDWDIAMLYVLGQLRGGTRGQLEAWLHELQVTGEDGSPPPPPDH